MLFCKMGGVTFCRRIVKLLLKTSSSELKSNCWVGDFQVAIHGGFWVATREYGLLKSVLLTTITIILCYQIIIFCLKHFPVVVGKEIKYV